MKIKIWSHWLLGSSHTLNVIQRNVAKLADVTTSSFTSDLPSLSLSPIWSFCSHHLRHTKNKNRKLTVVAQKAIPFERGFSVYYLRQSLISS